MLAGKSCFLTPELKDIISRVFGIDCLWLRSKPDGNQCLLFKEAAGGEKCKTYVAVEAGRVVKAE